MNHEAIEPVVLFEERAAANGKRIGIATLNSPRTLNGLSLAMAELLDAQLIAWAEDVVKPAARLAWEGKGVKVPSETLEWQ